MAGRVAGVDVGAEAGAGTDAVVPCFLCPLVGVRPGVPVGNRGCLSVVGSFIFVCIGVFGVCGVRKEGDDNVEVGKLVLVPLGHFLHDVF